MVKISAYFFELAQTDFTQIEQGGVNYHASETNLGGENAIDFSRSKIVTEGETFLSIPISQLPKGSFKHARVSLSYQEGGIDVLSNGTLYNSVLASFLGFNNYITSTHFLVKLLQLMTTKNKVIECLEFRL